jgi:LemA protein
MALELVVIVFFALAAYVVFVFNSLLTTRNKVKNSWAQIDVQLKKRADIIYNLVEIVKGYAKHEKTVLENITRGRANVAGASNPSETISGSNQLARAFKTVFAVAENYPELKANQNFLELQKELVKLEDDIAYARMVYNDVVTIYNTEIHVFPKNIIASVLAFGEQKLLEAADIERASAKVKM